MEIVALERYNKLFFLFKIIYYEHLEDGRTLGKLDALEIGFVIWKAI